MEEPLEIVCDDGWRLRAGLRIVAEPRAVAVLGHAMMVDRRTLDRPAGRGLASHLAGRGIAVLCPDLRGHGKSGPRAEEGGRWSYDDLVRYDVPALLALARARFPGLPLALVGHSLFGHVALAHVGRAGATGVARLVLLASNVTNPEWRARPLRRIDRGLLIESMGLAARLWGRFPTRRFELGTDDESRDYILDMVRNNRACDWVARDGFSYRAALANIRVPALAIVGAADRLLSPPADVRGLMAQLGGPVTIEVVGRSSGLPFDPGHMELVLDERARPAWDRVADFILA